MIDLKLLSLVVTGSSRPPLECYTKSIGLQTYFDMYHVLYDQGQMVRRTGVGSSNEVAPRDGEALQRDIPTTLFTAKSTPVISETPYTMASRASKTQPPVETPLSGLSVSDLIEAVLQNGGAASLLANAEPMTPSTASSISITRGLEARQTTCPASPR